MQKKVAENERTIDPVFSSVNKSDSASQAKSRTLSINSLSEKVDNKNQKNSLSSNEVILTQEILQLKWSRIY